MDFTRVFFGSGTLAGAVGAGLIFFLAFGWIYGDFGLAIRLKSVGFPGFSCLNLTSSRNSFFASYSKIRSSLIC